MIVSRTSRLPRKKLLLAIADAVCTAMAMFVAVVLRLGWQPGMVAGGRVFVLPSTSGRNGSLTRAAKLRYFRQLARWVKRHCRDGFASTQVAAAFRPAMPA